MSQTTRTDTKSKKQTSLLSRLYALFDAALKKKADEKAAQPCCCKNNTTDSGKPCC